MITTNQLFFNRRGGNTSYLHALDFLNRVYFWADGQGIAEKLK